MHKIYCFLSERKMIRNKINPMNILDGSEYSLASVDDDLYVPNNILTYDTDESIEVQIRHILNIRLF